MVSQTLTSYTFTASPPNSVVREGTAEGFPIKLVCGALKEVDDEVSEAVWHLHGSKLVKENATNDSTWLDYLTPICNCLFGAHFFVRRHEGVDQ